MQGMSFLHAFSRDILWCRTGESCKALMWPQAPTKPCPPIMPWLSLGANTEVKVLFNLQTWNKSESTYMKSYLSLLNHQYVTIEVINSINQSKCQTVLPEMVERVWLTGHLFTMCVLYMYGEFAPQPSASLYLHTCTCIIGSHHHHTGGQDMPSDIAIPDLGLARSRVSQITDIHL